MKKQKWKYLALLTALTVGAASVHVGASNYDNTYSVQDEAVGDALQIGDEEEDISENGYTIVGGEKTESVPFRTMEYSQSDNDLHVMDFATETDALQEAVLEVGTSSNKISADKRSVTFSYTNPYCAFENYVTKNGAKAKLLFKNELFSYDISSQEFTLEYTFPVAVYNSSGNYWSNQSNVNAYVCEDSGVLYYGYNTYTNTTYADEITNIVVYDLESGGVKGTVSIDGCFFQSVGADRNGNIFVCIQSAEDTYELRIYSSSGMLLASKAVESCINSFSGFCLDGSFYYVDEYMYNSYGYDNLMGRLMNGRYVSGTITLNETYMTYVKNIYFDDYRNPAEILNDKYLVTWNGGFYSLDKITDSSWSCALSAGKNLEMGSEYDYIYNIGVNSVIIENVVYTLYDNDTIYVYDLDSGEKIKYIDLDNKVVNLKQNGSDLLALMTDGTNYFYEEIRLSSFVPITTTTYNMNGFSVYAGRTKEQITDKFIDAVPDDYSASLFSAVGSVTNPYKEYRLSDTTANDAVALSNYYRWLGGLNGFTGSEDEIWTKAGKGAVLLAASDFSHDSSQPSDMPDEFYEAASAATSSSSIAMNYASGQTKTIYTIRQFLNDTSYTMPGHRNTFFTRNGNKIAYGMTDYYVCQTVEYVGNPNPQGTAQLDNNEAAYAWPSAGYFPSEELSKNAYWTVNLNTDKLNLSNIALEVTITDVDTGEVFTRKSSDDGLYASSYWGKYISFAPPTTSGQNYNGKTYKVVLSNLEDAEGMPAKLEYTIRFFSYGDVTYSIDGKNYVSNSYGQLAEKTTSGETTEDGITSGGATGGDSMIEIPNVSVFYRTHVQTYGWQGYVTNGKVSGTSGQAKRLEGIHISVNGNKNLGIQYTTHCQSYGWLPWSANNEMNGTEGEAKRLEAIKIQLTGADKDKYDVYYRVHAQSYGWLGWAKNGAPAGTAGYAKRLEAIQIVVVKKGESAPGLDYADVKASTMVHNSSAYIAIAGTSPVVGAAATNAKNPVIPGTSVTNVSYRTHVQTYGWQGWKYNGQVSGTSGQAKRLEGINIKLTNKQYSGGIAYTTHVQTYGWQGNVNDSSTWKKDGEMAGTSGQAKRLEAICIKLTGEMEQHYDIYYRVHAQTYGWLGWSKNGAPAGTAGLAKRLEGIQIVLVPKGGAAPANNYGGVKANRTENYIAK